MRYSFSKKIFTLILSIVLGCCFQIDLTAQQRSGTGIFLSGQEVSRCGTDIYMQQRFAEDPSLLQKFQDAQNTLYPPSGITQRIACDGSNTVSVPLAFHFDNSFSCADAACMMTKIQDAIATLNVDYGNNTGSPNAANCPSAYPDISTGTCITFYLAQPPACAGLNPSCDAPVTIGQFQGGYSGGGNGAGACWDDYLNVFVQSPQAGNLGVADQIPDALPPDGPGEGVTLGAPYFGGTGGPCGDFDTDGTYNLGKTLAHEIGHYLGLFHTFQGGCGDEPNNTFSGTPINVDDTPAQQSQYFGCPTGCVASGCGGGTNQQTANIMNYTDDPCMDLFTEDQAYAMNVVANGLFGNLSIPPAPAGADVVTTCGGTCSCPTVVTTPYSNTAEFCIISGDYTLPTDLSSVVSDESGTFVWSTGNYLSAGGTVLSGTTYTPTTPASCAPEDQIIYLNLTCVSDAAVELDAGTITLTVYPDPTTFATADLVTFTDGDCNGPTWVVTPGCEAYVTVAQNGGPAFPVTAGSGTVNYDVTLNYPTECCEILGGVIELVGTIGTTTLDDGNATQPCQDLGGTNNDEPAIWEIQFTIPPAQNATDVNGTGLGSIMEVCLDITLNNPDAVNITLDSPTCGSYEWEDLWLGSAFTGGSNTGPITVCFTPGTPNGEFDGTFDGDGNTNGTGTFENCLVNGDTWTLYIADYNCWLNGPTGGTINSATITFNDGNEPPQPGLCDFIGSAIYTCTTTACPTYTPPTLATTGACGEVITASGTLNPSTATNVTYNWSISGSTTSTISGNTTATATITLQNNTCVDETLNVDLTVTCIDDGSTIYTGTVGSIVIAPCTTMQACDDGDPCTENDMETVAGDGATVCVPCAGTAIAACSQTTVQACDDGDPCTENDEETIDSCTGAVCVPCTGTAIAACSQTSIQACDDGDPCTENDEETIDSCTGAVCVPCAGTAVAACNQTTVQACDDGDPCTENDEETIDSCTGAVCVPCAGTAVAACSQTSVQACDDGDPCTENDEETIDSCTGAVCVPCAGIAVAACSQTTVQACNDGDPCTENDEETIDNCTGAVCVPCAGTAVAACSQTTVQACNDGNANTVNDMETIDACTGAICIPCAGTPTDCTTDPTTTQACDDGDPCTENDMETTLNSDGSICVPCAGTPVAACSQTTVQACNDGDPCTENDEQTIDSCTGAVCVPCAGTAVAACTLAPTMQACDDGDPCTENDMEGIDQCDGSVCVPCAGTAVAACSLPPTMQACDDGDPCTENDMEGIDQCDGSVCVPCAGTAVATCTLAPIMQACDDGDPCTENDMEGIDACDNTTVCVPCAGTAVATCSQTSVQACDDGDPCTENDEETIDSCTGAVCVPCAGTAVATCTLAPIMQACDDGDPNTITDMEGIDACDGVTVCVPCAGIPTNCATHPTTVQSCDDGDACTINDVETILNSDGSICTPCAGTPTDCSDGTTSIVACNDGDPCTENDEQTILDCDGSVCVPCAGTPVTVCTLAPTMQACDDGNPNTINDMEGIDACDNTTVCIPCAGTPTTCDNDPTTTQACDDNDPCTENDMETILNSDGSICTPCVGTPTDCSNGATSTVTCDDGDDCTLNDEQIILDCDGSVCVPCVGTPDPACNCPTFNTTSIDVTDICAGDVINLTASTSDDTIVSFEWSVSVNGGTPIVFGNGSGATFGTRVYTSGNNTGCNTDVYEFFVNIICNINGSSFFNGSVGTVNIYPTLTAGANYTIQNGTCDAPATILTSCPDFTVTGSYQPSGTEAGSIQVTLDNSSAPTDCSTVTETVPYACTVDLPGCTDASADNFDPDATVDDGSCIYSGCTDPDAINYDATATVDDGSCIYSGCELEFEVTSNQGNNGGVTPFYYNTYTITVTNGTPPYNYIWDTDGFVRHAIISPGYIKVLDSDRATWALTVTDANGCVVIISEDFINGNAGGAPTLDIVDNIITCESGQFAYNGGINITISGGTPGYTYQWSTGATSQDIAGIQDGWYSVTVTDSAGDMTQGWYWVPQCGGGRGKVSNSVATNNIRIAPNPFSEVTTIEFTAREGGRAVVEVYDMAGIRVSTLFNGQIEGNTTYKALFNANNLPSGVYFTRFVAPTGEVSYQKLLLTK